jgi:hypothetical protein
MTCRNLSLFLRLAALAAIFAIPRPDFAATGSTPGGPGASPTPIGGGPGSSGVTLCLSKGAAPAGALAQMTIIATEPKPISTGSGSFSLTAFDSLVGIAVSHDTFGMAVVRGNSLAVSLVSPSSLLGAAVEYPILTVVGNVAAGAPIGTKYPLLVDAGSLQILDPTGTPYPTSFQPGEIVVNDGVAIGDVSPGSAVVPPGGTVTLTGVNFDPGTTVTFSDVALSSVTYIGPSRIDVTVSTTANMHGMKITATNPDGTTSTYYSYERTASMSPSSDPVMQITMPLLPPNEFSSATIVLPAFSAGTTVGVAVQNIEAVDTSAVIELLDAAGTSIARTDVAVSAKHFAVRELGELFGTVALSAAQVRVSSPVPLEVLGVAADQVAGTAKPILPQ